VNSRIPGRTGRCCLGCYGSSAGQRPGSRSLPARRWLRRLGIRIGGIFRIFCRSFGPVQRIWERMGSASGRSMRRSSGRRVVAEEVKQTPLVGETELCERMFVLLADFLLDNVSVVNRWSWLRSRATSLCCFGNESKL
jgi:hypothetical protein